MPLAKMALWYRVGRKSATPTSVGTNSSHCSVDLGTVACRKCAVALSRDLCVEVGVNLLLLDIKLRSCLFLARASNLNNIVLKDNYG